MKGQVEIFFFHKQRYIHVPQIIHTTRKPSQFTDLTYPRATDAYLYSTWKDQPYLLLGRSYMFRVLFIRGFYKDENGFFVLDTELKMDYPRLVVGFLSEQTINLLGSAVGTVPFSLL